MDVNRQISALISFKSNQPSANKADVEAFYKKTFGATKIRSVFQTDGFAFRFSEANTGSFSNVVLSLSALLKYDTDPFIVCIVRPDRVDFRLANTSFLKKISHSSHTFRTDNIRGSFLGHDILEKYEDIANRPEAFEQLTAIHATYTMEENIARLMESTNSIVGKDNRFKITADNRAVILDSPARFSAIIKTAAYNRAENALFETVVRHRKRLLEAAAIDNINLRGKQLEFIVTSDLVAHGLGDTVVDIPPFGHLAIDIKTKLLDKASAPKAYNVDKMLNLLAQQDMAFGFFFIGLSATQDLVQCRLISLFDPIVLTATRIQEHWAGRVSRGVTQLTGDLSPIFAPNYRSTVDIDRGQALLERLISR